MTQAVESQDNPGTWGIEMTRGGWFVPFKASPYQPFYSQASQDIEQVLSFVELVLNVVELLVTDDRRDDE